jgi:uncharacterized protein (TIGR04141 family)
LAELDAEVVRRLRAGEIDELSLAMPQIVDWHSLSTFRYDGIDDGVDHNELDLRELMQIAQQAHVDWTVERLSRVRIRVINSDGIPVERWSMHGCLFGEIRYQGVNWILSSGSWYQVSQGLVQEVERAFATVRQLHPRLPVYSDNDEEAYCVRVAAQHESWARMDRVPIRFGHRAVTGLRRTDRDSPFARGAPQACRPRVRGCRERERPSLETFRLGASQSVQ